MILDLLEDHKKVRPAADLFRREFLSRFNRLVTTPGCRVLLLESRVKTLESICAKVRSKHPSFQKCAELSDFVGVRVVTLYLRDVDEICNVVQNHFPVLSNEEKGTDDPKQFGYRSRHFVIGIPDSWKGI